MSSADKFASAAFAAARAIKVMASGNLQAAALTCSAALRALEYELRTTVSADDWHAYEAARYELQVMLAKTDVALDVADKAEAS